tara:strand:+ start:1 stop:1260 length:1260 start_codon:yes stop_codon:yes gene_type:complete
MLSKQAFNALLKTLEEPPEYLKFIFATTEIKKIPITVVSRCQRFDLSRIKSSELFNFIKNIKEKEKGNVSDEALKLIVKISEGSVRDSLSLLDRAMLTLDNKKEFDLIDAQEIFGYFDKSQLINLFELVLKGEETKVIEIYRKIYDQGVDPKVFLNDFLELVYYFKNIDSLTLESTNFSLNDDEFHKIKKVSSSIDKKILILFWQFTIKTLDELDIVSNQNLSIEMFLIRLMYLKSSKPINNYEKKEEITNLKDTNKESKISSEFANDTVDQIKNISQEKKITSEIKIKTENTSKLSIKSFEHLIKICADKKEMKLKYELEKNVNLVNFENNRIEISFNDNLDRNFVKEISYKLFEWTGKRWIITLSKTKGDISIKEKENNDKNKLIEEIKKTEMYKDVKKIFSDANLIEVKSNFKNED